MFDEQQQQQQSKNLDDLYIQYAEAISELNDVEAQAYNHRRLITELKANLTSPESDGSYGVEVTAHAFKQISERLEEIAMENETVYADVFKGPSLSDSLLLPSNLKSFIVTTVANARKKGLFKAEKSRSGSGGTEYRYTIDIKKWSGEKDLQFVVIVENNYIKTGFFNWV